MREGAVVIGAVNGTGVIGGALPRLGLAARLMGRATRWAFMCFCALVFLFSPSVSEASVPAVFQYVDPAWHACYSIFGDCLDFGIPNSYPGFDLAGAEAWAEAGVSAQNSANQFTGGWVGFNWLSGAAGPPWNAYSRNYSNGYSGGQAEVAATGCPSGYGIALSQDGTAWVCKSATGACPSNATMDPSGISCTCNINYVGSNGTCAPLICAADQVLISGFCVTEPAVCPPSEVRSDFGHCIDKSDPKSVGFPDLCTGLLQGNPINSGTGDKVLQEECYHGGGPYPLVYSLSYTSRQASAQYKPTFEHGALWMSNFDRQLSPDYAAPGTSPAAVYATRANGQIVDFRRNGSSYVPDGDIAHRLVRLTNDSGITTGWTLTNSVGDEVEL